MTVVQSLRPTLVVPKRATTMSRVHIVESQLKAYNAEHPGRAHGEGLMDEDEFFDS